MRRAMSWILYAMGDAVSRLLAFDLFAFVYPLYNWLMLKSAKVQGDGDGPWEVKK